MSAHGSAQIDVCYLIARRPCALKHTHTSKTTAKSTIGSRSKSEPSENCQIDVDALDLVTEAITRRQMQ